MKIAVCITHYGDVKAQFAESLARLIAYSAVAPVVGANGPVRLVLEPFFESSSILPEARTKVVGRALDWGAEWLLLLDVDQTFPPTTLFRLMAHGKPVVGCNAQRRNNSGPIIPLGRGLQEVDHLGLGVFLLHRSAFEAIVAQALAAGRETAFPLFMVDFNEARDGFIGEDVYFCRKLKASGFPVFCDHDLSRKIGHVGEFTLVLNGENAVAHSVLSATGDQ